MILPCLLGDLKDSAVHLARRNALNDAMNIPVYPIACGLSDRRLAQPCGKPYGFAHVGSRTQLATVPPFAGIRRSTNAQLQPLDWHGVFRAGRLRPPVRAERLRERPPISSDRAEPSGIPTGWRKDLGVFPQARQRPAQHAFGRAPCRKGLSCSTSVSPASVIDICP